MNNFMMQSLAYIIDVSIGNSPKEIVAEGTELDVAEAVGHALSTVDIESPEFETIVAAIGMEKYCDLATFKIVKNLSVSLFEGDVEVSKSLLHELTQQSISGKIFKKYITRFCITVILRLRLLSDYKDYVSTALELLQDSSINDISLFIIND